MDKQRSVARQCSIDAIPKTFALWQGAYAERHIPTFPVRIDKHPAIRGYNKVGLRGSEQLALNFIDAPALGFMCGPTSMVSVGDVDSTNDNFLADFLAHHGATPIIVRTASSKFHAWYKFNGELRRIRPWPNLPIDILGRGFVVAPPSNIKRGQYEFIQGSLYDIDRLPVMQNLEPELYVKPAQNKERRHIACPMHGMREGDGRNTKLLRTIGPIAREIYAEHGTRDALFGVAMSHNSDSAEPMTVEEVTQIVGNVWKMTTEHRNWIGRHGDRRTEVFSFITGNVDAFCLLEFLRVTNGAEATFWITNSLADSFGWDRRRFVSARDALIDLGYIRQTKRAWSWSPAEYIWA